MRAREDIRARASERHKARDKALPVGQRPVKRRWFITAMFSFNILLNLLTIWERRSELPGLLHHFSIIDLASLHFLGWKFVYVCLFFLVLVIFWAPVFQARAERRRVKEQRRAERSSGGEDVWPPAPRA